MASKQGNRATLGKDGSNVNLKNFYIGHFRPVMAIALLALILSGCSVKWPAFLTKKQPAPSPVVTAPQPEPKNGSLQESLKQQTKLKKFESLEDLKNFIEKVNARSGYSLGFSNRGGVMTKGLAMPSAGAVNDSLGLGERAGAVQPFAAQKTASDTSVPADYSKTNVQVEGVDEADIVKSDGKYLYILTGAKLLIVEAYPTDTVKVISKIELKGTAKDIYINGDRLIVFGADYDQTPLTGSAGSESGSGGVTREKMIAPSRLMPIRQSDYAFFKVYDITDRTAPKLVRDLAFEGSYFNSRMIGDYVYFITSTFTYDYDGPRPLPMVLKNGQVTEDKVMPPIYYFDLPYNSYNYNSIIAINVKDDSQPEKREIYLLAGEQNLFVSQNSIYITYTKYVSEEQLVSEVLKEMVLPKLDAGERDKITKIEQAENFILSEAEKLQKVNAIIERYVAGLNVAGQTQFQNDLEAKVKQKYNDLAKELEKTVVHKIAIDKDKVEYKTFGEVNGHVLNQFSMDESGGYFRIATTKARTWSSFAPEGSNESYSNLFVLDSDMKVIGSLEGLAKGEQIYSARFLGKRAYLVTFKQTDPLFAIDLSEPTAPKVLGELKIPGFSNYLHPYDETTLIGLGKDTKENEWGGATTGGLKLSLFDVSAVDKPIELDNFVIGSNGSDSIALTDHRAFLFSLDKNLLVIPASLRESADRFSWGRFTFSGALVFNLEGKKLALKGRVDHSDGGVTGRPEYWGDYSYYDNTVRRSLYVNDILYTLSPKYLKLNQIIDLKAVKSLNLEKETIAEDATAVKRDEQRLSDIKQIQTALELYFNDHNRYPSEVTSGGSIKSESTDSSSTPIVYMSNVPVNPTPGGMPYAYTAAADGENYKLVFKLEAGAGGFTAGVMIADTSGISANQSSAPDAPPARSPVTPLKIKANEPG
jgi:uncharacterized secreted protein with C-terminal beta-propeller domain